jgi:glycosyltransferase involved in cell wall biosynthesis
VYNGAATIGDCVRSLLALRYPAERLELRVVDDGSRDRTGAVLDRYRDRVVVMHAPHRGRSAARNAGWRATSAEVVAYTDADCVVDPEWVMELVAAVADEHIGAAGGTITALPPASPLERFGDLLHDQRRSIEVFQPPYVISMNWASRREVLMQFGGFEERFHRAEDVDLTFRMLQAGYGVAFAPGALIHHRNKSSIAGLFSEGYADGFHGVRMRKRHHAYLSGLGHPRIQARTYAELATAMAHWARRNGDSMRRYEAVFNAGKKVGKAVGSARFGHLDL